MMSSSAGMRREEQIKTLQDRLRKLQADTARVQRAYAALSVGAAVEDDFRAEVSDAEDDSRQEAYIRLYRMIESLLSAKYGADKYTHLNDARDMQEYLVDLTRWVCRRKNTSLIQYLENNLQDGYEHGIALFKWMFRHNEAGVDAVLGILPGECPWKLEELLQSDRKEKLLERLPDRVGPRLAGQE
jgi:hypothetical protein